MLLVEIYRREMALEKISEGLRLFLTGLGVKDGKEVTAMLVVTP